MNSVSASPFQEPPADDWRGCFLEFCPEEPADNIATFTPAEIQALFVDLLYNKSIPSVIGDIVSSKMDFVQVPPETIRDRLNVIVQKEHIDLEIAAREKKLLKLALEYCGCLSKKFIAIF